MDISTTVNKPSIGILLISTWKYNKFIDDTIAGIRKYFFPNSIVKIFLHTDSTSDHDADVIIPIQHQPWPLITLKRYELFCCHQNKYNVNYLIYLDIDSIILGEISESILHNFFVVQHWVFMGGRGTPETNPQSKAFVNANENISYVAGGLVGGEREYFLRASKTISNNIQQDLNNNIIAIWHDESHLNRYVIDNPSTTIIDQSYMSKHRSCNPKIIPYYDWEKGFNKFENGT